MVLYDAPSKLEEEAISHSLQLAGIQMSGLIRMVRNPRRPQSCVAAKDQPDLQIHLHSLFFFSF